MWIENRDRGPAPWTPLLAAVAALLLVGPAAAAAQSTSTTNGDGSSGGDSARVAPARSRAPGGGRLRLELGVTGLYDSNIDHDEEELESVGMVAGGEAQYRNRWGRGLYTLQGGLAAHRYTGTDRWNRISKLALAAIEQPVLGPVAFGLNVQLTVDGTSEDRVLNDQLMLSPRLLYRFGEGGQLGAYGALRFRKSARDGEPSTNTYLAARLRTAGGGRPHAQLSSRWEVNRTDVLRNRFTRWTHSAVYSIPLDGETELSAGLQYTTQDYPDRPLELEEDDGEPLPVTDFRRDRKWTPQMTLERELVGGMELVIEYEYELRASNDPDREYQAHLVTIMTRYRW